jgi:hypothetical protein
VCLVGDLAQGDLVVLDERGLVPGAGLATEAHVTHMQARLRGTLLDQGELGLGFVAEVQLCPIVRISAIINYRIPTP